MKKVPRRFVLLLVLAIVYVVSAVGSQLLSGQSTASQPSVRQPSVPQWQIDAGGKAKFDVASVKQNTSAASPESVSSNVPLDPMDAFTPTGGLFTATNQPLAAYMVLAYKLSPEQTQSVQSQLPKWANTNRYDIQAKGSGNPTKDQIRLMMQTLLADRFKLVLHHETRQVPVLALVVDKAGKIGPQLQAHPDSSPCSSAPPSPGVVPQFSTTVAGGFPEICGVITPVQPSAPGRLRVGARGVPLSMFTKIMNNPSTSVGRTVLDKTGLVGEFDFVIEFTPQVNRPPQPGAGFQPDPTGPTFLEALKEQLGLKLESQTGSVDVFIVDRVEEPSTN